MKFVIYVCLLWNDMQSSLSAIAHTSREHDVADKFRPFDYQATFCPHLFLASKPNTIILTFNRRVQEKVLFISKKYLLCEFQWQTKILL